jgi:hypothetical protein
MSKRSVTFVEVLLWGVGGIAAIVGLAGIINNPKSSPSLRFVAQTIEGIIVQDMETGVLHLLV